jgi:hypothetical protein
MNPLHEGNRINHAMNCLKPLTIGMALQWHLPLMMDTIGTTASGPMAILRNSIAVACVFFPVKSLGFNDFGECGLSQHEKKMNNLLIDCEKKNVE